MPNTSAPLNALRAFEAAARTGAFTSAAQELGVSSAAISQQVKLLEAHWGKKLFVRQGNRIALTEAGLTAYPALEVTMTALADLSDRMRGTKEARRLVLSVPHSVAETWLAQAVATLDRSRLKASLHIRVDGDPIDFAGDTIDMRVFYGHNLYSEYRVEELFTDTLIGVVSPEFATQYGLDPHSYEDHQLIHSDWGPDYSSSPNWSGALTQVRTVNHDSGLRVNASSTAVQFARQGLGAALVPRRMAAVDLEHGSIVALDLAPIPMAHGYKIAYPNRLAHHADVQNIVAHLKR